MTYKASKDELRVLGLLSYSKHDARTTKYLTSVTGFSERRVRQIMGRLIILCGVPITGVRTGPTKQRGYYIVTDEEERAEAVRPLNSEIRELTRRKNSIEGAEIRTDWYKYLKGGKDDGRA